jgi:MoaE-MoaD fusion protein
MITIRFFASLKDKAGTARMTLPVAGISIAELMKRLADSHPALEPALSCGSLIISVNRELVKPEATVQDGDEVAFMPPFSGGDAPPGHVRLQQEPFSVEHEIARLKQASTAIGAVVTFLGTTRDLSGGRRVSKLDFEHYPGMAEQKLSEIRERAIREFGVIDVTIVHRTGTMPVGENIVLIAVAAAHREEAFAACRLCIDELKRITPIWKKETTPDGEIWVEEHP